MTPTIAILENVSRNSTQNKDEVFTRLYRYMLRPDLYYQAYAPFSLCFMSCNRVAFFHGMVYTSNTNHCVRRDWHGNDSNSRRRYH